MVSITVISVLGLCLTTLGQATYTAIGLSCDRQQDCTQKKCEFGIISSCAYGTCVCEMEMDQGYKFFHELKYNIERYLETHYYNTVSRQKRSMIFEPRNRLSKKIADTITFEESRINKRSTWHAPSTRYDEMLYSLQGCSDNSTDDHLKRKWITVANALGLHIPIEEDEFFKRWTSFIKPFSAETVKREEFARVFSRLSVNDVVSGISTTKAFQNLFWPFVYEVAFMNQKLALLGLTGREVPSGIQKSAFYAALENIQNIKISVVERKVTYSFYDTDIIRSMVHYDGFSNGVSANNSKKHLFSANERREIIRKTDAALELIKETMPDLHRAINQMVGCIAFYKAEDRAHISGSMTSAIGVIWFDPSATVEWTIPFYAEQIVHEYIHTSLYVAELVHGMFSDHGKLPGAKVMSSIRLEKRDYDKSFHACYVSTGLVVFHAKAGFWTRAQLLAETINTTIEELVTTHTAHNVLTPAGEAMLHAMKEFSTAIRLI